MVVLSWLVGSAFGALPFVVSGAIPSYTDAFFETISGFTTTGASILPHIEGLPYSGAVLALAHPLARRHGHRRAHRGHPAAARHRFDALTHTFGTLATGGFSPRDASVGAYDSAFVDCVVTVFMLLAAVNFSLYFQAFRGQVRHLSRNLELRVYLVVFAVGVVLVTLSVSGSVYGSIGEGLRYASFQVASILTTTGYATANFDVWPPLAKGVLVTLMLVGGCAGSTAGGVKVIRLVTLFKQALNELKYLVHPQGIFTLKIGDRPVKKDILYPVAVFFFLYITLVMVTALIVAASGQDLVTAITTGLATVGNIGPGFGAIGPSDNYAHYPDLVKWWLSFAMLTGRLEVYSVLVLLTPTFWRN